MAYRTIYENNDHVVEVSGLKNALTGEYITAATVQMSVYKNGVLENTGTWPLSMSYVADSKGIYRGVLRASLNLVDKDIAKVVVTAVEPGSLQAEYSVEYKVAKRK